MQAQKATPAISLWLLRIVQGVLIGIGAILPGLSGGALCVLFGIYQPMMSLLSHPFKTLKQYLPLFIPVILGVAIGFVGGAKVLSALFQRHELMMLCLFIGLIVGVLPSLFREAGEKGRTKKGALSFAISFIVLLTLLFFLKNGVQMTITPNFGWYIFCGVIWGLSMIVPGLSSSNILLFFGLYEPMNTGIGSLDMAVLLPLGIGFLLTVLTLARSINHLFETQYEAAYHFILGTVLASTVMIIPTHFTSFPSILMGLALAVIGFIFAIWMDRWSQNIKKENGVV